MNRLHVAIPPPRDNKERPFVIPESVRIAKEKEASGEIIKKKKIPKSERKKGKQEENEMDIEDEKEDSDDEMNKPFYERAFNRFTWNKKYDLADDEWKFDTIPEFIDGKNIADFVDPDILKRLEELEKEEEARVEDVSRLKMEESDESDLEEADWDKIRQIRERKKLIVIEGKVDGHKRKQNLQDTNHNNLEDFTKAMQSQGVDPTAAVKRLRSESREGRKRLRSKSPAATVALSEMDEENTPKKVKRSQSLGTESRSRSKTPSMSSKQLERSARISREYGKQMWKTGQKGEADRTIGTKMPKHLFSGKRKGGKTDRR